MTGASSGIGKELAVVLHREGARLTGNVKLKHSIEVDGRIKRSLIRDLVPTKWTKVPKWSPKSTDFASQV